MSIRLMAQVWEYHWTHPEQGVLLALADHAHDDGTNIYPSVEYIAWKSEYSERQVQRIISDLRAKGILEPVRFTRGGRGHATEYHLHLEKGVRKAPFIKKGDRARLNGDATIQMDDISEIKDDAAVAPEPSIEPSKNIIRTAPPRDIKMEMTPEEVRALLRAGLKGGR